MDLDANEDPPEALPLLPSIPDTNEAQQQSPKKLTADENAYWDDGSEMKTSLKKRNPSLIAVDSVILLVEIFQVLALVQSMSMRWTFPDDWLKYTSFIFLINLDVWDFSKMLSGKYKSIQSSFMPSTDVPIDYRYLLIAWLAVFVILVVVYIIVYAVLNYKKHPYLMVKIAKLQRIYLVLFQLLALPLGVLVARIFHCNGDGKVDTFNDLTCFGGLHWAYLGPSLFIVLFIFTLLSGWMFYRIKHESVGITAEKHEGYLQLREIEYMLGLDITWILHGFAMFSSFKRIGEYFRPVMFLLKFSLVSMYAGLFNYIHIEAITTTVILFLMALTFIIIRPFRVTCFNVMLILGYILLSSSSLMGALMTATSTFNLSNPWLLPENSIWVLVAINGLLLLFSVIFVIYLICSTSCSKYRKLLWPSETAHQLKRLNPDTQKYIKAILRARYVLEKSRRLPAMFAPAHELSRQIQIINAYSREAEYMDDEFHDTLVDILDELIDAHSQVVHQSLFADSIKETIRDTATDFMQIMPAFVKRLAQREFDFILVPPVKKRLLLKMLCLSTFMYGRRERIKKTKLNQPALYKVWHRKELEDGLAEDDYYKDMYLEPLEGPYNEAFDALSLDRSNVNGSPYIGGRKSTLSFTWQDGSSLNLPGMIDDPDDIQPQSSARSGSATNTSLGSRATTPVRHGKLGQDNPVLILEDETPVPSSGKTLNEGQIYDAFENEPITDYPRMTKSRDEREGGKKKKLKKKKKGGNKSATNPPPNESYA